jgi:outer membrane protein OmpA-like peptidoglycan-associated protein
MTPSAPVIRRRVPLGIATALCLAGALAIPPIANSSGEISSVTPTAVAAGSSALTLTVNGTFPAGETNPTVFFDDGDGDDPARLATSDNASNGTATELMATVPAALLREPGERKITVWDCSAPSACENPSDGAAFTVLDENPAPTIASLLPSTVATGTPGTVIQVNGTGFIPATAGSVDGNAVQTTFVSDTEVALTIPAGQLATGGVLPVTVSNPSPGGGTSGAASLTVENPSPVIAVITPVSVVAGSGDLVVNVTGSDFVPNAVIEVGGAPLSTTVVSPGMAIATIPAAALAAPGTLQLAVRNPAPGGGRSGQLPLTVQAPPPGGTTGGSGPPSGPSVAGTGPLTGAGGSLGTLVGSGFGAFQGSSIITVGGVPVGRAIIWRDARIEFKVPDLPPGTYPVQIITNGIAVTIGEYTIGPTPPAPPTANPVLAPGGGRSVIFDASLALGEGGAGPAQSGVFRAQAVNVTGITSIIWRFGDGTTSNKTTVSKTYDAPGEYRASVTVTDAGGRSSTVRQTIRVRRDSVDLPPVNLSIPNRVVFDFGSAELREEAKPVLRKLAKLVRKVGRRSLIGGHTDAIGPAAYNLRLSEERAKAVRRFLIREGKVSPLLLAAVGFGESAPIDTNATPLGRQRNRRVTLQIARSTNPITLSGRTAQINQRIATAVLLRERALRKRLAAGLTSRDVLNGTFYSDSFSSGVIVTGSESADPIPPVKPRPIAVPKLPKPTKNFPFTRRQLRINERISRTAVVRVNALIKRLEGGLEGGDVRRGAITTAKLAPGLSFASVQVTGAPQKRTPFTVQNVPLPKVKKGPVTEADLLKDQRRSQAAIRRINILISRFNEGFSVDDFAPGAIEGVDVTAG